MTDRQLYKICKRYGRKCLEAKRRFAGLLPEVLRRNLHEKKGFCSIYEFAAKLAGMTREQVDTILRLDRRYEDKQVLRDALVQGKIGSSKLIRIASIATAENQSELFETARKLSKNALDVFVKEYRRDVKADESNTESVDGLFESYLDDKSLPGQNGGAGATGLGGGYPNFDFEILAALSPEVKAKLKDLIDKKLDVNALLLEFFERREQNIKNVKDEMAEEMTMAASRHIPAKVVKLVREEYGDKCAVEGCSKDAANIHHERGFALTGSHDPRYLKPLCLAHHEIEHKEDAYYQRFRRGRAP